MNDEGYPSSFTSTSCSSHESAKHCAADLAELRFKLRKLQQELDEKNEIIIELTEILDQNKDSCDKLRQENLDLVQEARSAKYLRDEIDILNERVIKVDRLETEIERYRYKISDLEFMKTRLEEIREDNRLLSDSKAMLEEQLESCRKKNERLPELESQVVSLRALSEELRSQISDDKNQIKELVDQINQLQVEKKTTVNEMSQLQTELSHLRSQVKMQDISSSRPAGQGSNSLFEELNNDASKKLLKLELENQKLVSILDNLKGLNVIAVSAGSHVTLEDAIKIVVDKLDQMDSLKSRLEEIEEENRILSENKAMLEEQLEETIKDNERLPELESQVTSIRSLSEELESQIEQDRSKMSGLVDQMAKLRIEKENTGKEMMKLRKELDASLKEVSKLKLQKDAADDELAQLRTEISRLRMQIRDMEAKVNQPASPAPKSPVEELNVEIVKKLNKLEAENKKLIALLDQSKSKQPTNNTSVNGFNPHMNGQSYVILKNQEMNGHTMISRSAEINGNGRSVEVNGQIVNLRKVETNGHFGNSNHTPTTNGHSHHHAHLIQGHYHPVHTVNSAPQSQCFRRSLFATPVGSQQTEQQQTPASSCMYSSLRVKPPRRLPIPYNGPLTPPVTISSSNNNTTTSMTNSLPATPCTNGFSNNNNTTNNNGHIVVSAASRLPTLHYHESSLPSSPVRDFRRNPIGASNTLYSSLRINVKSVNVSVQSRTSSKRTVSPTPSTVGTDSVWYEYGCV
jgi:predicted  nucleic acid-binding Zn-ribbon protein